MRWALLLLTPAALMAAGMASGQSMAEIRAQAEEFAREVRDAAVDTVLVDGAEVNVPGYQGTDIPAADLADDPDALTSQGELQRSGDPYNTIIDPYRPVFDPTTIDLSSAQSIAADPDAVLGTGMDLGGGTGSCEPLPAGGGGTSTYLDSCNQGLEVYDETSTCNPSIVTKTEQIPTDFKYFVAADDVFGANYARTYVFANEVSRGMCRYTGRVVQGCAADREVGREPGAYCQNFSVRELVCSSEVTGIYQDCQRNFPGQCTSSTWIMGSGQYWFGRNYKTQVTAARSDAMCDPLATNASCLFQPAEICVEGPETRVIDGQSITQACWKWQRTYQCQGTRAANDCSEFEGRSDCSFDHQECLSEDAAGNCTVYDRWFQCQLPGAAPQPPQYVCAGDLYCMDGECSTVERQASTEFKDAMVAVQTMGEVRADFDPDTLRLFTGEGMKCSKKVFGISNCCSGKGVPLLTPWLCDAEDRAVDERDDKGLCHKVGSYCSDSVLGVCVTRKQSYCCFSSKLTRILQEQGRAQLGMGWGKPKTPTCDGFLVEQFQQLDLSRMDFSEVYQEFTEAARLPDEIEASMMIQERIGRYYDTNGTP